MYKSPEGIVWEKAPEIWLHEDGSMTLFPVGFTDKQFAEFGIIYEPDPAPEQVEPVMPSFTPPTVDRKTEIMRELTSIDRKSIRPIREGETARLAELTAQAVILRQELATL